jgi:glycosyltransferase involved in cell wall biosynthesis
MLMIQEEDIRNCSIVLPVYFNEGSLTNQFNLMQEEVIKQYPELSFEVIFVDDGSRDKSIDELTTLYENHPETVKIIQFTRNFGQVNALIAGMSYARGQCVITLSADGQDPVYLINQMLEAYYKENYDVVICHREDREESYYRKITSKLFYSIIRNMSFPNMPQGGFDCHLLSRRALTTLLDNREAHPFLQGQILYMGYPMKMISYTRLNRKVGKSRWTFRKKYTYMMDGIIGYSFTPIRLMTLIGFLTVISGIIFAISVLFAKLRWGNPAEGWAAVMIAVLILGGIQMLMMGINGEYQWRTLDQVRNRHPYVIKTIYDNNSISTRATEQKSAHGQS